MGGQNFGAVCFSLHDLLLPLVVQNDKIEEVAESFRANVKRVHEMICLPATVTGLACRYQAAEDFAILQIMKERSIDSVNEVKKLHAHEVKERRDKIVNETERVEVLQGKCGTVANIGGPMFLDLIKEYGLNSQVQSLLVAIILASWTTIETMLADLWETAVNLRPSHLSRMDRGNFDMPKGLKTDDGEDCSDGKSFTQKELENFDFNVAAAMGTMLRSKLKFINLRSVTKAYLQAFYRDFDEVEKLIKDDSFNALFIIRNVFVHKGGKADPKFLGESKRSPSLVKWHQLGRNADIEIDGDDAKALILPAFQIGVSLIVEIDKWITNHPEPRPRRNSS